MSNTNTNETIADILREMRNKAAEADGKLVAGAAAWFRNFADRIEAAAEREFCDAAEIGHLIGSQSKAKQVPGGAAAPAKFEEAADRLDAAERRESVPSPIPPKLDAEAIEKIKREMAEMPITTMPPTVATPAGNAAAMREALNQLRDWAILDINENAIRSDETNYKKLVDGIVEITNAALSAPARNCDVGTADEQADRFEAFCHSNRTPGSECSKECPFDDTSAVCYCQARWAQMLFAKAEGGSE